MLKIKNERVNDNLHYHSNAILPDINNPLITLKRLKELLFSPAEDWEKTGNADNVVFPTGAVIDKSRLYTYYGAADKLIALKSVILKELLEELKKS